MTYKHPKLQNPIWVFDITIFKGHTDCDTDEEFTMYYHKLKEILPKYCKKWAFQLETGDETERLHYQGRISMGAKTRTPHKEITEFKFHWSATSEENKENNFYVIKKHTRVDGPWTDKDKSIFIPKQYRNINLYPWQKQVLDSTLVFEPRICNVIYDPKGCSGKSTVAALGELLHNGHDMPMSNDYKELLGATCNMLMDHNITDPKIMFFDMPRAIRKDQLNGLYSAIEQIKKGKAYDFRYKYKSWWFNSPQVWVFTNVLPDLDHLSEDRWAIWEITNKRELVKFQATVKTVCNNIKFNSLEQLEQNYDRIVYTDDEGNSEISLT